ncbi:flagellar biosynthesis protein FlhF [Halobacillus sp. A5]|uniref:flagellar biosynthesis protein FlhF n=1 Tax=Halobacillus sp. A5 TaxID=2880263 RepID=UPI0020A65181|nr:flagellar biosynthesis protein FlhF [Halobacillus sp. A5]MCP3026104.1 flagellar biosynthesis protein FlhF [Halobacillus sp. A5]
MKVKKFQAPSMPEVMTKVKKDLGKDAVILNSKEVKAGGFLGMFRKPNIEVIAAIDPEDIQQSSFKPTPEPLPARQAKGTRKTSEDDSVMKEIKELKFMLQQSGNEEKRSLIQETAASLKKLELDHEIIEEIMEAVKEKCADDDLSRDGINKILKTSLLDKLSSINAGHQEFSKKYIHLVGPTGVGKTTTIAKLASEAVLNQNKKVAFITTDTYRIAAVEQLKVYAKLLDAPLKVAYSVDDYRKARESFSHYDLVFIDTAGRNFKDRGYVNELTKLIDFTQDTETFLVLSLTSRYEDMKQIHSSFDQVPINKLIFTKKDETSKLGGAVSLAIQTNTGIAFITHGQDVPDDIESADPVELVETVAGDYTYE